MQNWSVLKTSRCIITVHSLIDKAVAVRLGTDLILNSYSSGTNKMSRENIKNKLKNNNKINGSNDK